MPTEQPNIVVVMTDDHGQWASGCYGNSEIITPAIDWLATTGLRFTNAFTPSPVCSPARASFWTGRFPSQHGIHDFLGPGSEETDWMKDEVTVAQFLHDRGYVTGLAGKWHLGQDDRKAPGFDYWYAQSVKTRLPDSFDSPWSDSLPLASLQPSGARSLHVLDTEPGYDPHAITDHAVHFLRTRERSRPFFLFVGLMATHSFWSKHPEHAVDRYRSCTFVDIPADAMYPFGRPVVEATFETRNNAREALAQYYAAVSEVDSAVGRLLDELASQALMDSTVFVYTSDHGCMCGHHGLWGKGNATRPLNMLEESIRVPLVISFPEHEISHQVRLEMVDHCDLFQTLLEVAGVGPIRSRRESNYPGRSFLGALEGTPVPDWRQSQLGEYGDLRMLRTDRYKLIRRYSEGLDQLMDLETDPRETSNVLAEDGNRELAAQMTTELEAWFGQYEERRKSGLIVRELPRHNTEEAWRDLQ